MSHFQAIVIGAGPGGYPCGIRLAQLDVQTLIIEKEAWGGVCLNVGCIPSKALITAGKRVQEIKNASKMGIILDSEPTIDMTKLQQWKGSVVDKLTKGVQQLLKANGAQMLAGTAEIVGEGRVKVTLADGEVVEHTADHVVLATGSVPIQIPGFSFEHEAVMDSTDALALDHIPASVVVIGGGYIGLEMGMMLHKLGTKVTIVEAMDQLLPGFDPDVVKLLQRKLKQAKIPVHLSSKALGFTETEGGIEVQVETPKGTKSFAAEKVLVTVGRRPVTRGLGLEALQVELDGPFIKTDDQRRTNLPWLYAIGDVAGQPMLAHKASREGELVAEVIAGHEVRWDVRTVPAVVFTDPEVATAGLQEHEARQHHEVKVGKVPYAAVGRSLTTQETDGFFKVISDAKTGQILGVTIAGAHASDLISEAALAVEFQAQTADIGLTIHPHPTLGEGIMEAAKAALGEAIHIVNAK